jgi:hypothetical protein
MRFIKNTIELIKEVIKNTIELIEEYDVILIILFVNL